MRIKSLLLAGLICGSVIGAPAQEKITNYSLNAGILLSGNIYSSGFTAIPGFPNCCSKFEDAFGLKPGFFFGGEYRFSKSRLFGMEYKYGIRAGYNDLSADYEVDEFIGNRIKENTYEKIISTHELRPVLKYFSIEQYLGFTPIESLPIGIRAGFNIGFMSSGKFDQKEILKTPKDVTFENGKTERNVYSADLPNPSTYYAIMFGLEYKAFRLGNFSLVPQLDFNYGISDAASGLDWKISSARAGIALNYDIPTPTTPPPARPPMPKLPPPPEAPKPAKLELAIAAEVNGRPVANGSTINVIIDEKQQIEEHAIVPVIFFEKNSTKLNPGPSAGEMSKISGLPAKVVDGMVKAMKSDENIKVRLLASEVDDEDKGTARKRAEAIAGMLKQAGIPESRIMYGEISFSAKKFKYPELADERRSVAFETGNRVRSVDVSELIGTEKRISDAVIKITPSITADAKPVSLRGEVSGSAGRVAELDAEGATVKISSLVKSPDMIGSAALQVTAKATDAGKKEADASFFAGFAGEKGLTETVRNIVVDGRGGMYEFYLLGCFDFNGRKFSSIDRNVVERVQKARAEGKKIEISPMTDYLGSKEYNAKLAEARAEAALKIIGREGIDVVIPEHSAYEGRDPYSRLMSRSVFVIIK